MHFIVCGRLSDIFEQSVDPETGKKELTVIGSKMKTEKELAYEPALLVEMERVQSKKQRVITHLATVIKDRFGVLDGKECENPTFDFFLPHIKLLTPGAQNVVDTSTRSEFAPDGTKDWFEERKQRKILSEEISEILMVIAPGQAADNKKLRADLCEELLGTRSWTRIETETESDKLRKALVALRERRDAGNVKEVK